jgi:ABC-type nitrate/sulfonate/bicarbonate transport system substrate-binding protein
MRTTNFRTGALLTASILMLGACGSDEVSSTSSTADAEETAQSVVPADSAAPADSAEEQSSDTPVLDEKLRIGVGIDAAYAPFFVAEEQGLFEAEGLQDVELIQFARGGEAVDALGAGQVDLAGNSDTTTLTMMASNPIFRALMVYQESGDYLKLVARPEIEDFSEIKKMGVVPGLSEYNVEIFVEDQGLSDVEYISASPAEIPALLNRGDIDAFILWEPWPVLAVELGAQIMGVTGDFGSSYVHWLVATEEYLEGEGNADYAAAVARALAKAAEFVEADPQTTAVITEAAASVPIDQTLTAIDQIDFGVRGFDESDLESYKKQAAYLIDRGLIEQSPDLGVVIDRVFYVGADS